ncbi:hypothetical protein [Mollivirus kamchatka]|nr:hypothetical protein [Mollivirus kamchatka]
MSLLIAIVVALAALAIGALIAYFAFRELWSVKTGQTSVCGTACDVAPAVRASTWQDCRDHVKTINGANVFVYDPSVTGTNPNCSARFVDASTTTASTGIVTGYRDVRY